MLWLPLIWLLATILGAPRTETAWRFSYVALTPLILVASVGISGLIPADKTLVKKRKFKRGRRSSVSGKIFVGTFIGIMLLTLVVDSWSYKLVADAATNLQEFSQAQRSVYDSLKWMKQNTPPDSGIISVTDWRYEYAGLLVQRTAAFAPLITPDDVIAQIKGRADTYVIITRLATIDLPADPTLNPFNTFANDSRFGLVYQNSAVNLYKVISASK